MSKVVETFHFVHPKVNRAYIFAVHDDDCVSVTRHEPKGWYRREMSKEAARRLCRFLIHAHRYERW